MGAAGSADDLLDPQWVVLGGGSGVFMNDLTSVCLSVEKNRFVLSQMEVFFCFVL